VRKATLLQHCLGDEPLSSSFSTVADFPISDHNITALLAARKCPALSVVLVRLGWVRLGWVRLG